MNNILHWLSLIHGMGLVRAVGTTERQLRRLDRAELAYHARLAAQRRRETSPHVAAAIAKRARKAEKLKATGKVDWSQGK